LAAKSAEPVRFEGTGAGFWLLARVLSAFSVLILSHSDSFDWENPESPKNLANGDGFDFLPF
jgi:hypothetical protein